MTDRTYGVDRAELERMRSAVRKPTAGCCAAPLCWICGRRLTLDGDGGWDCRPCLNVLADLRRIRELRRDRAEAKRLYESGAPLSVVAHCLGVKNPRCVSTYARRFGWKMRRPGGNNEPKGRIGMHNRWHVARGKPNPDCKFCRRKAS